MKKALPVILFGASLGVLVPSFSMANGHSSDSKHDHYVSFSYGIVRQDDSNNDGNFTSDFSTGVVTGVPAPLAIPSGADVGWDTDFDRGDAFTLALGKRYGAWRYELEYSQTSSDVDSHQGVNAAGIGLDAIDVGVLISGNVGDVGATTGAIVADGRGEIETSTLMVSANYDWEIEGPLTPFVGIGVGYSKVDVNYEPSGIEIIDDDDSVFVYQLMAGASYDIQHNLSAVLTIRYRDGSDAEVDATLIPAEFEIENSSLIYDLGLRYWF